MTFVAFESAAVALPQEITPNAFASSCGKPPHPLMENRGYDNIIIAVFMHVFVCQLFKGADRRNILNKVAALAVADGDIANSLLCCKQSLNNRNRMDTQGGTRVPVSGP